MIDSTEQNDDGPSGSGFGQDALMNICKPIDTALMNGQKPYPPVFSWWLTEDLKWIVTSFCFMSL